MALDPEERGTFYLVGAAADQADNQGTPFALGHPPRDDRLTLVAGFSDSDAMRRTGRPVVLAEHGSGQRYVGPPEVARHGAYSGGDGHEHTRLFVCPSETVANRWRVRYPDTVAVAVGCPKLDFLHRKPTSPPGPKTVCITFHSQANVCVESGSAWNAFEQHLPAAVARLRAEGVAVLGHGHPRIFNHLKPRWEAIGVEAVRDASEIFGRAHLLCLDNSSIGPEFASLGRPLAWMAAPWWRRNVHHGGRFWEWPQGQVQCDEPEKLAEAVLLALTDPPSVQDARQRMVRSVYAFTDGHASERAVAAIRSVCS